MLRPVGRGLVPRRASAWDTPAPCRPRRGALGLRQTTIAIRLPAGAAATA
jgi:hypothetical protein